MPYRPLKYLTLLMNSYKENYRALHQSSVIFVNFDILDKCRTNRDRVEVQLQLRYCTGQL